MQDKKLYLASRSPRRAALLRQMGFTFETLPADVPEDNESAEDPVQHALALSRRKAEAVLDRVAEGVVVGADTVVVLNGVLFGKPRNGDEARDMLARLSGKTHTVVTGFTLIHRPSGQIISDFEKTDVTFRSLESWEVDAYASTPHPLDKAGAYGIQDPSGLFVERIDGCFYNVVGFPLTRFYGALKRMWGRETLGRVLRGTGITPAAGGMEPALPYPDTV